MHYFRILRYLSIFTTFLVLSATVARASAATYAYVAVTTGNKVTVIDVSSMATVATIPVACNPYHAAASPDGLRVYVAHSWGCGSITAIDTATNTVVANFAQSINGAHLAVSPDGTRLYAGVGSSNGTDPGSLQIYSTANHALLGQVAVPDGFPTEVALSPDGTRAYVVGTVSRSIIVIDTVSMAIVGSISLGGEGPYTIAISPDGSRLLTANYSGSRSTASIVNAGTSSLIRNVSTGSEPLDVVVHPNGQFAYVSNSQSGHISVIDLATNQTSGSISYSRPHGLAIDGDGRFLYVVDWYGQRLTKVDLATNQHVGSTGLGGGGGLFVALVTPTPKHQLTVSIAGTGQGSVASVPSGIACTSGSSADCAAQFTAGVQLTLTASPASGYEFSGWSGCSSSSSASILVSMNGNQSCTANFAVALRKVSVVTAGNGTGTVTSVPAGIACASGNSAQCTANFVLNSSATFTASPGSGSIFAGWSGCTTSLSLGITIAVDADKSCTATFRAPIVPQIGWWSTPDQPGRGYGIEASNSSGPYKVLLSVFAKKRQGEGGWFVAELDMKADASGFAGPMFEIDDGQDLLDIDLPKRKRPLEDAIGNVEIAMTAPTNGSLTLPSLGPATPAATVTMQRFEFVEGGLSNPRPSGLPQAGWWTSPEDNRWATFFEVQTTSTGQPVLFGAFHRMQKKGKVNSFFGTATLLSNGGGWLVLSMPLQDCKESIDLDITGKKAKACRTLANQSTTLQFLGSGTSASFTRPEGKTSLLNRYGF